MGNVPGLLSCPPFNIMKCNKCKQDKETVKGVYLNKIQFKGNPMLAWRIEIGTGVTEALQSRLCEACLNTIVKRNFAALEKAIGA